MSGPLYLGMQTCVSPGPARPHGISQCAAFKPINGVQARARVTRLLGVGLLRHVAAVLWPGLAFGYLPVEPGRDLVKGGTPEKAA